MYYICVRYFSLHNLKEKLFCKFSITFKFNSKFKFCLVFVRFDVKAGAIFKAVIVLIMCNTIAFLVFSVMFSPPHIIKFYSKYFKFSLKIKIKIKIHFLYYDLFQVRNLFFIFPAFCVLILADRRFKKSTFNFSSILLYLLFVFVRVLRLGSMMLFCFWVVEILLQSQYIM